MTAYLAVAAAALFAAGLTLYSGFGLGTLLLPVFALFYPIEVAVAATAVVHGANNVFKVSLVGRYADRGVVLRFGVTAIVAAFLGAALLGALAGVDRSLDWSLGGQSGTTTPLDVTSRQLSTSGARCMADHTPRLRRTSSSSPSWNDVAETSLRVRGSPRRRHAWGATSERGPPCRRSSRRLPLVTLPNLKTSWSVLDGA